MSLRVKYIIYILSDWHVASTNIQPYSMRTREYPNVMPGACHIYIQYVPGNLRMTYKSRVRNDVDR